MLTYTIRRLLMMIPMFIGITIICFIVIHLAPGNAAEMRAAMGDKYSETARAKFEKMYGLDKPLYEQYIIWIKKELVLDFC